MRVSELKRRAAAANYTSRNPVELDEETNEQEEKWWADLLVFVLVGLGTIWLYSEVSAFEAGEGTLHRKFKFLYDIIGKWVVVGFPACIAVIKLCTGLAKLSRRL